MAVYVRRVYARNYRKSSITYTCCETDKNHKVQMLNSSIGGMCFKSKIPLKRGTEILVEKADNGSAELVTLESKDYPSKVKWCNEISNSDTSYFGIGVQYYEPIFR